MLTCHSRKCTAVKRIELMLAGFHLTASVSACWHCACWLSVTLPGLTGTAEQNRAIVNAISESDVCGETGLSIMTRLRVWRPAIGWISDCVEMVRYHYIQNLCLLAYWPFPVWNDVTFSRTEPDGSTLFFYFLNWFDPGNIKRNAISTYVWTASCHAFILMVRSSYFCVGAVLRQLGWGQFSLSLFSM